MWTAPPHDLNPSRLLGRSVYPPPPAWGHSHMISTLATSIADIIEGTTKKKFKDFVNNVSSFCCIHISHMAPEADSPGSIGT